MPGDVADCAAAPDLALDPASMRRAVVAMALMLGVSHAAADAPPLPPPLVNEQAQLDARWRLVTLPAGAKPATRFSGMVLDGRAALRVQTQGSYGNLVHEFPKPMLQKSLSWAWRVEQGNARADLRQRSGDDAPLRVCLSFDMPLASVPFVERQLLRLASLRAGEKLPPATLCYVWDHQLPHDTLLDNAYTRRVRMITLRNGRDASGQWFTEQRDIAADFRRAFGDESAELLPLSAMLVGADSDNTGVDTLAFVAELRLAP